MKILFLHGLDSKPFQDRIDILSKYGTVDMPFIDYRNEPDVFGRMSQIASKLNKYDVIIGHSMGGLVTYYLSNKYKIPALMFMPAFSSKNKHFANIPEDVIKLPRFDNQAVVIATNDTVIDNTATKPIFPSYLISEEPIGHNLPPDVLDKHVSHFLSAEELREMIITIADFKKHFIK